MSRLAVVALLFGLVGCTKSPPSNQDTGGPSTGGVATGGGERRLNVPGNESTIGGDKGAGEARFRLAADEGKLVIETSGDAKAGGEAVIKVTVNPGELYKVNTEFPTKLTLENTQGVTIAKAELKAGGHDKAKGDADVFEEKQLVFAVKLTPAAAGNYTVNGTFKFAVCDKAGSTCLAKKEPIAIQLAAK
ncbi:MAG: hypothetical protein H0V17_30660 [Deltaproteobacteria bacterium]|nr:hypothetical protein [Deltaproteobacteria bacterium]